MPQPARRTPSGPNRPNQPRRNDDIRAREVRLIGVAGAQEGVMSLSDALARAQEAGLDLVEVAPDSTPPVCRLLDWGKEQFAGEKKRRAAHRARATDQIKEVQLRPAIDAHDLATKASHAARFLAKGMRVRVVMNLHGRYIGRPEQASEVLERFLELVGPAAPEGPATVSGRRMVTTLRPATANHTHASDPEDTAPSEAPEANDSPEDSPEA